MEKLTLDAVWKNAREIMAPNCRVCPVCDGRACRGEVPGMGSAGDGSSWSACMDYLRSIKLNMDTIYEYSGTDVSLHMFGHKWASPVFISPIGITLNTNRALTEDEYVSRIVAGAQLAGILPFTGDGNDPLRLAGIKAGKAAGGMFVPTLKPWKPELLRPLLDAVLEAKPLAVAMDIDAAGFANMGKDVNNVGPRSVPELRDIAASLDIPFILKGVMTPKGAEKAAEAGAYGIVISTHGGRVIASAPATCRMIPSIRAAIGDKLKIFLDGGIRTGGDVFKALALGADAVMIGRPFTIAAHGGGAEGVALYADSIRAQLTQTMKLCGASDLTHITRDMILE